MKVNKVYIALVLMLNMCVAQPILAAASSSSSWWSSICGQWGSLPKGKKALIATAGGTLSMLAGYGVAKYFGYLRNSSTEEARTTYYDVRTYGDMIENDRPRHVPLMMILDDSEIDWHGKAMVELLGMSLGPEVQDHVPVSIITSPSLLLYYSLLCGKSDELCDSFFIYSLVQKNADLILLIPKKCNGRLRDVFNIVDLKQFVGESRELIKWLCEIENKKIGHLFDEQVGEVFVDREDIVWDVHVIGHGEQSGEGTVGVTPLELKKLLDMFNEKMHAGVVHLLSCYLPGVAINNTLPKKETGKYRKFYRYPLVVNGIYDKEIRIYNCYTIHRLVNYFNEAVFLDKGEGLNRLLSSITEIGRYYEPSVPQVLLPGHDDYQLFDASEDVLCVGNVLCQKTLREERELEIKEGVVSVSCDELNVPLKIYADYGLKAGAKDSRSRKAIRYPLFVFLKEQRDREKSFSSRIGDISLDALPSIEKLDFAVRDAQLGIHAFLEDSFRPIDREEVCRAATVEFLDGKQVFRHYHISSITGPNDFISWLESDSGRNLIEGFSSDESPLFKTRDECITISNVNLIFLKDIYIKAVLDFDLNGYHYSFLIKWPGWLDMITWIEEESSAMASSSHDEYDYMITVQKLLSKLDDTDKSKKMLSPMEARGIDELLPGMALSSLVAFVQQGLYLTEIKEWALELSQQGRCEPDYEDLWVALIESGELSCHELMEALSSKREFICKVLVQLVDKCINLDEIKSTVASFSIQECKDVVWRLLKKGVITNENILKVFDIPGIVDWLKESCQSIGGYKEKYLFFETEDSKKAVYLRSNEFADWVLGIVPLIGEVLVREGSQREALNVYYRYFKDMIRILNANNSLTIEQAEHFLNDIRPLFGIEEDPEGV